MQVRPQGRALAERAQQRVAVALGARHLARGAVLEHHAFADRQHGVDHGDIDELALAAALGLPAGRGDAVGQEHGRRDVADPGADLGRRAAGLGENRPSQSGHIRRGSVAWTRQFARALGQCRNEPAIDSQPRASATERRRAYVHPSPRL